MRAIKFLALTALLFGVFAGPAVAQDFTGTLRGGVEWVLIDGDTTFKFDNLGGERLAVNSDDGFGLYLGYEWRSKMFGLELSGGYSKHDVNGKVRYNYSKRQFSGDSDFSMYPLNLALNFHVLGRSWLDFYIGPVISYVFFSGGVDIDDAFAYGAQLGADWNLGGGFAINTALRYQYLSPDVPGADSSLDINPMTFQAGVAWRF